MSDKEKKALNEVRAILADALTSGCGCSHCARTAAALDKLREICPLLETKPIDPEGT